MYVYTGLPGVLRDDDGEQNIFMEFHKSVLIKIFCGTPSSTRPQVTTLGVTPCGATRLTSQGLFLSWVLSPWVLVGTGTPGPMGEPRERKVDPRG